MKTRTRFFLVIAAALCSAGIALAAGPVYLSEMLINPPGTDNGLESFELKGPADYSLAGWYLVVVEGDGSTVMGIVDQVIDLGTYSTGSNGLLLIRDSSTVIQPAPATETVVVVRDFNPDIENGANTFVLGYGTPPAAGADLDTDNDCFLDSGAFAGFTVADAVSFIDGNGAGCDYADDLGFFDAAFGDLGDFTPDALYRVFQCVTGEPYSWAGGDITGTAPGPFFWAAAPGNFGWAAVGIANPEFRTLDLGSANYEFGCAGACCLADGFCEQLSEADCATAGGSFQGNGVPCTQGLCPGDLGACCLRDGTCENATRADCEIYIGGTFQGAGTDCGTFQCPQPTGACCVAGECQQLTEVDCAAAGGAFLGLYTVCNSFTCDGPGEFFLSELMPAPPGDDNGAESVEIQGPPNASLAGWWFIVIEGDLPTAAGTVDQLIDLGAYSTGSNGLLLIRDSTTVLEPAPDPATNVVVLDFTPDLENGSNTWVLAFGTPSFIIGDDLDIDNDDALDTPWSGISVVDALSYVDGDPADDGLEYADDLGGFALNNHNSEFTPDGVYRILTCDGLRPYSWAGGDLLGTAPGPYTWDPSENFGWNEVGIPDPSTRSVDPGTLNYTYCTGPTVCRGDLNCDGVINFGDINPFVLRLSNQPAYQQQYPDCPDGNGDVNNDGAVNFGDISAFVALLSDPPPCP